MQLTEDGSLELSPQREMRADDPLSHEGLAVNDLLYHASRLGVAVDEGLKDSLSNLLLGTLDGPIVLSPGETVELRQVAEELRGRSDELVGAIYREFGDDPLLWNTEYKNPSVFRVLLSLRINMLTV